MASAPWPAAVSPTSRQLGRRLSGRGRALDGHQWRHDVGGSYALDFASNNSANRLIVNPGAVFNGMVNGMGRRHAGA
jgi:hypothetical protein